MSQAIVVLAQLYDMTYSPHPHGIGDYFQNPIKSVPNS